jgi:hypothetical protein
LSPLKVISIASRNTPVDDASSQAGTKTSTTTTTTATNTRGAETEDAKKSRAIDSTTRLFRKNPNPTVVTNGLLTQFDDVTTRTIRALYASPDEWERLFGEGAGSGELTLFALGEALSAETERKVAGALRCGEWFCSHFAVVFQSFCIYFAGVLRSF